MARSSRTNPTAWYPASIALAWFAFGGIASALQAPAAGTGLGAHGGPSSAQPAGSLGAGISRGPGFSSGTAAPAGALGFNAPTLPTFELQRNPHATFEVPGFNNVQPYRIHGQENGAMGRHHYGYNNDSNYGYPFGYFPGFPGYIDTTDGYMDQGAGNAPQGGPGDAPPESGYDAQQLPTSGGPYAYPGSPADSYAGPPRRPPYTGAESFAGSPSEAGNPGPVTDGLAHPEITLIFNNGRPPLQVRNYVLTGEKIIVIEGNRQRQIPVSELDIRATEQKNAENGVDFSLPARQH